MPDSVETSATISELEDRLYDNAEIISCSDGMIVYKWNGKKYQCVGELEKDYLGVADIEVKKHQIVRVKVKNYLVWAGVLSELRKSRLHIYISKPYR